LLKEKESLPSECTFRPRIKEKKAQQESDDDVEEAFSY